MIAAAFVVGAWSGDALALPLVCVFPALWAFAPSRLVSAFVCTAHFLAASRGLPQGVVNFYGCDFGVGVALWIGAVAVFVFVHATLLEKQPGWNRAFWFALAAILMSVPHFGIVGGRSRSLRPASSFRNRDGGVSRALLQRVREDSAEGVRVVVLPESAVGLWTPTTSSFFMDGLRGTAVTVIVGAAIVDREGYDSAMLEIGAGRARKLYGERMPVPVSMWQP